MTKTTSQAAAAVLSVLMAVATVAGMNGIATKQYAKADSLAMAPYGQTHVAMQHVTVVDQRRHDSVVIEFAVRLGVLLPAVAQQMHRQILVRQLLQVQRNPRPECGGGAEIMR